MITESIQFEGLSYDMKSAVWNPLDFVNMFDVDDQDSLDLNYIKEIEEEVETVAGKYSQDRANVEPTLVRGFEVGDDNVSLSNSIITLSRIIVMQERVLKMKTSWKDTYISETDWNFCEVTSALPCSKAELYSYCVKTRNLEALGFNDYPAFRTVLNVTKGDKETHSSTVNGKSSLLGRKLSAARRPGAREILHVASWLQDGCLRTTDAKDPKYLPGTVGGCGCPDLWDNPTNTFLFIHAYKFGEYVRVYGSAINELRLAIEKMELNQPANVVLCRRLRQKQEYLHVTYAGNVLIPESDKLSLDGKEVRPLYKAIGTESLSQGIESRLLASRRVMTRHKAEVELLRTERINFGLFGFELIKEKELLQRGLTFEKAKQYGGALRANAAVSRLLKNMGNTADVQKLISEGFLPNASGVQEMSKSDAYWLADGGKGQVFSIHDIPTSEDIFLRAEVSLEESLKVPGIDLSTVMNTGIHLRTTVSKIGLWQISEKEEEWADKVVGKLIQRREYGLPMSSTEFISIVKDDMTWISDDGPIMAEVIAYAREKPSHTIGLVSSDIRLGKRLRDISHLSVVIVLPEELLQREQYRQEMLSGRMYPAEDINESLCKLLRKDEFYSMPKKIFFDTGSISSYAMRMDENVNDTGQKTGVIYKYEHIESDIIDGYRTAKFYRRVVLPQSAIAVYACSSNGNNKKVTIMTDQLAGSPNPANRIARFASSYRYRKF